MQQDPTYTELCSSVTLQSNKQGFFFDFANNVAETVGSAWIDGIFGGLRTDEERLKACHELGDCVHGVLQNVRELYRQKSASLSAYKRQEAERYLGAGDPRQALPLCNHAVIRAPPTGRRKQWRLYCCKVRGGRELIQEARRQEFGRQRKPLPLVQYKTPKFHVTDRPQEPSNLCFTSFHNLQTLCYLNLKIMSLHLLSGFSSRLQKMATSSRPTYVHLKLVTLPYGLLATFNP